MYNKSGLFFFTSVLFWHSSLAINNYQRFINGLLFPWRKLLQFVGARGIEIEMPHNLPLPIELHRTELDLKERLIIIGDIHGCIDEFKEILSKCSFNPTSTSLVLVGDLVNKGFKVLVLLQYTINNLYLLLRILNIMILGPNSLEVIRYARSIGAICVRGNHDDSCLKNAIKLKEDKSFILPSKYSYITDLTR